MIDSSVNEMAENGYFQNTFITSDFKVEVYVRKTDTDN